MSGWLFIGFSALISVGLFFIGRRFARMTENPWAGQRMLGLPVSGSKATVEEVRRLGLIFMIAAPIFLLIVTAISLGLLGQAEGIDTIDLT
ncbi:MAG TPA: hypothetical protein VEW26_05700 [Allosphingosinicella sp.]|nr:hypothetical protein [Allosphingosinicella sp.]